MDFWSNFCMVNKFQFRIRIFWYMILIGTVYIHTFFNLSISLLSLATYWILLSPEKYYMLLHWTCMASWVIRYIQRKLISGVIHSLVKLRAARSDNGSIIIRTNWIVVLYSTLKMADHTSSYSPFQVHHNYHSGSTLTLPCNWKFLHLLGCRKFIKNSV